MGQLRNKEWWEAAATRAVKTFAQTAVSMLTVGQAVIDVNWVNVLSISAVSAAISVLTSIAGLPEVKQEKEDNDDRHGEAVARNHGADRRECD